MKSKITIKCDDDTFTHIATDRGSYATICGLDGDDPVVGQKTVKTPRGQKVDCPHCCAIWCDIQQWQAEDFDSGTLASIGSP